MSNHHSNTTTAALPGAEGEAKQRPTGKGQVPGVAKNMPALLGVMGQVDRLYRPQLASRLFGEPLHPPSSQAAVGASVREEVVEVKLHAQPASGTKVFGEGVYKVQTAALKSDLDRMLLQTRMKALEERLGTCDATIHRLEDAALGVVASRSAYIAKKKNRLGRIRTDVSLARQSGAMQGCCNGGTDSKDRSTAVVDFLANAEAAHALAVSNASHNPMAKVQPVAICRVVPDAARAPATAPIYCDRGNLAKVLHISDAWKEAVNKHQLQLVRECVVPRETCTSELRPQRGPRSFPHLHSTVAPFATHATPSAVLKQERPMMNQHVSHTLNRQITPIAVSRPIDWFQRELTRSVSRYNDGIVFTPPFASIPAVSASILERHKVSVGNTVPLPRTERAATVAVEHTAEVDVDGSRDG